MTRREWALSALVFVVSPFIMAALLVGQAVFLALVWAAIAWCVLNPLVVVLAATVLRVWMPPAPDQPIGRVGDEPTPAGRRYWEALDDPNHSPEMLLHV